MGKSQVRVRVIPTTLKMVITAPQPMLVIISLRENTLVKKGAAHTAYALYNGPPDKGGIIQRVGCLIR